MIVLSILMVAALAIIIGVVCAVVGLIRRRHGNRFDQHLKSTREAEYRTAHSQRRQRPPTNFS